MLDLFIRKHGFPVSCPPFPLVHRNPLIQILHIFLILPKPPDVVVLRGKLEASLLLQVTHEKIEFAI